MTNNTIVEVPTNIKFRSKFEKNLTDTDKSNIISVFEKFCGMKANAAYNILWLLTYSEDSISVALNTLGLESTCIPAINLRDELRYQYNTLHPGFLTIDISSESQEIKEAYECLKKKTDLIVSYVVYQHCRAKVSIYESDMSRAIYLLESDDEKNFFGGIRNLGFNYDESTYLKPFHKEICNLFTLLYNDMYQANKNMPFKELQKLIPDDLPSESIAVPDKDPVEKCEEISAEPSITQDEKSLQTDSGIRHLTAYEILANRDTFTSFAKNKNLDSLDSLLTAGFDTNQLISKRVEISNFLDAVEALNK